VVLPLPFRSKRSWQQLPLSTQHCSSAGDALSESAIDAHCAGGDPSWQDPNESPSALHVCVPQALQYPMKQTRELPGTHTEQRAGQALYWPATQYS
jgi:hypothetical protein